MDIPAEMDEAARLILREMVEGKRKRSLVGLKLAMSEEFQIHASVQQSADLWTKYMGWDERKVPTHDLATGESLSMLWLAKQQAMREGDALMRARAKDFDSEGRDEIDRFNDGDSDG